MIWYKVILTSSELTKGLDMAFERDFSRLFMAMNEPEEMKLYRSGLFGDQHLHYYIQIPESFGYDLGKVFSQYRTTYTTEPDTKNLVLAIGSEDVHKAD